MVFLIFVIGLLFGSFFNVCIYRIPREQSIVFPPSHCTSCSTQLKWYDLIPVVSYIMLKGRCRYCGEKVSIRYPLIEFFTAFLWVLIYYRYGYSIETIKFISLCSMLLIMAVIDLDTQDVYFSLSLFGIILGIIFICIECFMYKKVGFNIYPIISNYVLGGIIPAAIMMLIVILTKGMGWGDVEISFVCGLFLGIRYSLFMLLIAFILGGIVSIILIVSKRKSKKDAVPFVPFIAVSAVLMSIYGDTIFNWYFINFIRG
ncbi:prepilin peptidase [Haloimpatiens sp. FM7330]|uniref:prepilin peptidase n=1 Tax=Haloimpatiens sp. FM7330 TaxID=3298610 RepID=UPI00363ABE96